MLNNTEKKIITTIFYYDEMDYPMTAFEIWKYLTLINNQNVNGEEEISRLSLSETIKTLESMEIEKYIENFKGFYFLKGRKSLVEIRIRSNKISLLKLKKLRRIVWLLRFIPYVRMIAATGRLGMKNAKKESDLDLFVVLKKGKIWTGRTLVTIFLHIIGKRRYGKKIKGRICLNYFVTDESLEIETKERDHGFNLFSSSEYYFMMPLFGFKKFRKFQMKNSWISDFKPNYSLSEVRNVKMINDTYFSKTFRKIGEFFLSFEFIENFLRKIEREKIAKNPKTHNFGSVIEAKDESLVFLPEPQGTEIYKRCKEKLISLGAYF